MVRLDDEQPPTRFGDAKHLGQCLPGIGEVLECSVGAAAIEASGGEREVVNIATAEVDPRSFVPDAPLRLAEHRHAQVEADHVALCSDQTGHCQGVGAKPAADIEHRISWSDVKQREYALLVVPVERLPLAAFQHPHIGLRIACAIDIGELRTGWLVH
jgi:hypothetical protein